MTAKRDDDILPVATHRVSSDRFSRMKLQFELLQDAYANLSKEIEELRAAQRRRRSALPAALMDQ